ncbi:hypothetical protein HUS23_08800 [Ectothiorhodospiraceae bacterium 2226]|nr:hypothetical protein HUS23_08800 [Ectothiorhodospiraceae bacterium 2226]
MPQAPDEATPDWPALPYEAWRETCTTLHLWMQIVGKVRLAQTPWVNHSWHVTLYLNARGLTTSPIPHGDRAFELTFDFQDQTLVLQVSDGGTAKVPLQPGSVADFYAAVLHALDELGVPVRIHGTPNEIPDAVPFSEDRAPRAYDPEQALSFWRALLQVDRVFKRFRSGFVGKVSPVHFFWGSFDLAVTRFSGRAAPPHPGGIPGLPDAVTREAYSHEVSSAGFWPGGGGLDYPAFLSYAYPEPPGFRQATVQPQAAFFDEALSEFILPYDAVRAASAPDELLMAFLQSTYQAAADAGNWERPLLECPFGRPRVPRPV